ncbi:S41 family peptidase [Henriciella mobilis]|uniref:Tail specific protease domain-containing protein n=1 Tax=Henriciella mobilis TaxID=2305467 RepID=A0A399RQ49_9PROT|nr:S41 family peptidase [Henriciella mobilis]RIJ32443.1 hypothetical protein D1223_00880 [Henriciella mobilis]
MIRHIIRTIAISSASLAALGACALAEPETNTDTLSAAQAIEDLDRLYEGLEAGHANLFAATPKPVFDAKYEALRARYTAPVSLAELHSDFQRFTALAHHAHARINSLNPGFRAHIEAGGKVFPLKLSVVDGEVVVAGAPSGSDVKPGDRLRALEGEPNPIWLAGLLAFIPAETPALAYSMMSGGEPYYMWLAYGPKDTFNVTVERSEETITAALPAIPIDEIDTLVTQEKGFDLAGREARLLSETVGYLRPGPFFDVDATEPGEAYSKDAVAAFTAFVDDAFTGFIQAGVSDLVLDLRDNPGGDNSFSDPIVAWFADEPFRFASDFRIRVSAEAIASNQARLETAGEDSTSARLAALYASAAPGEVVSYELPYAAPRQGERFEGDVHVLVNRYSYSNAVTVAALIQDYRFGTIYGEPTRDMATTYGGMEQFTLPNTGFPVGFPKAHIIRPNGDETPHPVTPDVPLRAPAIRGAEDVRLDALVARIREAG